MYNTTSYFQLATQRQHNFNIVMRLKYNPLQINRVANRYSICYKVCLVDCVKRRRTTYSRGISRIRSSVSRFLDSQNQDNRHLPKIMRSLVYTTDHTKSPSFVRHVCRVDKTNQKTPPGCSPITYCCSKCQVDILHPNSEQVAQANL